MLLFFFSSDFDGIEVKTCLEFNKLETQLEGGEEAQSELKGPVVCATHLS